MKWLVFTLVFSASFLGSTLTPILGITSPKASALSGGEFQAGRIIDDGVFFNGNSMNSADIQAFLNAKTPTCDTWGARTVYDATRGDTVTRKVYGERRGVSTPFTCLKDYRQDIPAKNPEEALCNGIASGSQKTAAQIIDIVAKSCGVSPKVLLIVLQKEQSLVTDDWPFPNQYTKATGYGCPDSSLSTAVDANQNGCYDQHEGFFNQMYMGARIYKYYAKYTHSFNHIPGRNNNVLYHPNAACGSSPVYIQNQATAGLYNYTPYQPNAAALNNLYGTGDGCSAYGNRNFWRMFHDWFGSTTTDLHTAKDTFRFERLVGSSPSVSTNPSGAYGTYSTTITAGSLLHVFYYNDKSGSLDHSWHDANGWKYEVLDGAATTGSGGVKANVGAYVTGFYDSTTNKVEIFYYNATTGSLRQGSLDIATSSWQFTEIDGKDAVGGRTSRNVGKSITATKLNGHFQVFYYDADWGNLRHAWTDARGWHFENLDGDAGSIARRSADVGETPDVIALNGHLQLFYYDKTNRVLRHAWTDARGWHFENLDGDALSVLGHVSNVGWRPTVKNFGNDLFVLYYDAANTSWRMAYADQGGWHGVDLDGTARSLSRSNLPVRGELSMDKYGSSLQIFYQDASNGLRHSWTNR